MIIKPRTFVVKKNTPAVPVPKTDNRQDAQWMQNVRERLDAIEKSLAALQTTVSRNVTVTDTTPDDGAGDGLVFVDVWDASAGMAPAATPTNNTYWIVSVSGMADIGAEEAEWVVGDWAVYVNDGWHKIKNSEREIDASFSFGDVSPAPVGGVDGTVVSVSLVILEAFDGVGAALSIGTVGSPSLLMDSTQNDPTAIGTYIAHPSVELSSENVVLTIVPGAGATQGSGIIYLEIG